VDCEGKRHGAQSHSRTEEGGGRGESGGDDELVDGEEEQKEEEESSRRRRPWRRRRIPTWGVTRARCSSPPRGAPAMSASVCPWEDTALLLPTWLSFSSLSRRPHSTWPL
jgi:hypothetical protein